ncbi:hypothetical protein F53441_4107 [Fusarium austroafricanum]|uniref:Uncharacterized protein n=1 Tax=Fusarium austroafricanum TaxID=2364996 RepID=A0A8H4P117_9HYPO|nr:hypothetical protein F53441_4107 [Fusarium austroafricanum]
MGIFSSLLGSIPTAARWLIGNSGTIGDVVNAVRDVIKTKEFEDEDGFSFIPEPDLLPLDLSLNSLENDLKKANKILDARAKKDLKRGRDDNGRKYYPNNASNLLWTVPSNPVGGTSGGIPSAEMYRDLALILREKDFPLFFTDNNDDPVDVTYRLAQGLFSNIKGKGITITTPGGRKIRSLPVSVASGDDGCIINAQHVYYEIPMGKTGTENAWQAALHMNSSMTPDFILQWEAEQAELVYYSDKKPPTGPVWILTFEIDWRTVLKAKSAGKNLADKVEADHGYYVSFCNIEANIQSMKIITAANVAPAQARANVEVLAGKLSRDVSNPSLRLLDKVTEPLTAQGPDVNITNAAYNNDYKGTSDYQMAIQRQVAEAARREARNRRELDDMTAKILAGEDNVVMRQKA